MSGGGSSMRAMTGGGLGRPMATGGVVPSETHVHIHPGQVVNHPEVGDIGEKGKSVAVVPLHDDGTPKTEAMNDSVKALLAHPEFQKAVSNVVGHHSDALRAALEHVSKHGR
jgi:hypothetical protein